MERVKPWLPLLLLACGAEWTSLPACSDDGPDPTLRRPDECLADPTCTQVLVVAHRGYHADLPENSLAALRAAATLGADLSEVDVRHTLDGVLVLMHDAEVNRTTDGSGLVAELTWAEIQTLQLDDGDPQDPESCRVPRFVDALALAEELGTPLYVDQKTDATALVLQAIQSGPYHHLALVRDTLDRVAPMAADDSALLVMPAIETAAEFQAALDQVPDLLIVELSQPAPDEALIQLILAAGVKVQQDVMALGDTYAAVGDYTGWKSFVDLGVTVLQTEFPQLLVPVVLRYNRTGDFSTTGPGLL